MISLDTYRAIHSSKGRVLGEVRKVEADRAIDKSFHLDVNYRIVYMQVSEEEYELLDDESRFVHQDYFFRRLECKYQRHAKQSILADSVDYYLQFRPGTTVGIGKYVIIPDEQSFEPDFEKPDNWWMTVMKSDIRQFPQYMVLQCNWDFKWIYQGELYSALGCLRDSNSYTSGQWTADMSTAVDDTAAAWLPDMPKTQTIPYDCRFMLSYNKIHPRVYKVTKNNDTTPQGVIKLTFKQDFVNESRDNIELGICDYYDESGVERIDPPDSSIQTEDRITLFCAYDTIQNRGLYRKIVIQDDIVFTPIWTWTSAISRDPSAYSITEDGRSCKLLANRNLNLVGDVVTIAVVDSEGFKYGSISLEVIE